MDHKKLSNIICAALSVVILVTGMVFTVNPELDLQDAILSLVRLPHSTFSYIMNHGDPEEDDREEEYIQVLEDEAEDREDSEDSEGSNQDLIRVATGKKPSRSRKKAVQTALDTFDPSQNTKPQDTVPEETKPQQQVGGSGSRKPVKVNYLPVDRLG